MKSQPTPLIPVADALARVLDGVTPSDPESVRLGDALGRTLAAPLKAKLTHPPFDASSMDGYAVRAADITSPPTTLALLGVSAAGRPFAGKLDAGHAIRIFTGAPVPDGADAVVIQEDTRADGTENGGTAITILAPANRGDNIRCRGQDFAEGQTVLRRGRRLGPREILMCATSGHANIPVIRKPTVAILATGDELVEPGTALAPGQITSSNSYGLAALITAAGGHAQILGIARDTHASLAEKFAACANADILVTTGGASVGDHDLVRPALEAAGAKLDFYKIAMRPGKPTVFGTRPRSNQKTPQRILGLPGNPLSAMIGARVFLIPLIAALLGRPEALRTVPATLAAPLPPNGPRDHYMRATLDTSTIPPRATPLPNQDSSLVSGLTQADCLLVVPANAPAQAPGSTVAILPLDF